MGSKTQSVSEVLWNCSFSHKQMYGIIPENNTALNATAHSLLRKMQPRSFRANTKAPGELRLGSIFPIRLEGDSFYLLPALTFT